MTPPPTNSDQTRRALRSGITPGVTVDLTPADVQTPKKRSLWQRMMLLPEQGSVDWTADIRRGYQLKKTGLGRAVGLYAPAFRGAPSTTRQGEILNTAVIAAPTGHQGIYIGRDRLSRTAVAHDTITAYTMGIIDSPNAIVLGDVGSGKSSLTKTVYVVRPMLLRNRRIVVVDKKGQLREGQHENAEYGSDEEYDSEGEYTKLARDLGIKPIVLRLGSASGGSRLNLMDPALLGGTAGGSQFGILQATAELSQGGKTLEPWEAKALRLAHATTLARSAAADRDPVLPDLLFQLRNVVDSANAEMSAPAKERLHQAGLTVEFLLDRLWAEELEGLFDGETTNTVKLNPKLTVFDISALPDDGPASTIAMMIINRWLLGTIKSNPGSTTNFVVEEGWHLVGGPAGRVIKSNTKLSRALGLANIVNLHRISDIPNGDPAIGFIREAQTIHMLRQSKLDDAVMCQQMFGLKEGTAEYLQTLPRGDQFLKIGTRSEIRLQHTRSEWETHLTNTDGALTLGEERGA